MFDVYQTLASLWPESPWLEDVCRLAAGRLKANRHGDLSRWKQALGSLPTVAATSHLDRPVPELGAKTAEPEALRDSLMALHPWRKGPLRLGGVDIETEWRSDWKWDRLASHVDLAGNRVLDIGCGNGYFGYRMLGAGAELVVGIDPTLLFVMQWLACRHFAPEQENYVLPLGIEDLPAERAHFDTVFSMGVLYHRKDPAQHLRRLRRLIKKKGGTMVLETLVLTGGREEEVLIPENRYARMRNVWAVPGTRRLLQWVRQADFRQVELVDTSVTTVQEQRSTGWMHFESLAQALDPNDRTRTIEGYPAPVRGLIIAHT